MTDPERSGRTERADCTVCTVGDAPRGLVLFAHGARDPRWAEPLQRVAEAARRARPDAAVRIAFLELMSPALDAAVGELAAGGCRRVDVVPVFLGMGGHVRDDLPPRVAAVQAGLPGVEVVLHPALGERDDVVAALAAAALAQAGLADNAE